MAINNIGPHQKKPASSHILESFKTKVEKKKFSQSAMKKIREQIINVGNKNFFCRGTNNATENIKR